MKTETQIARRPARASRSALIAVALIALVAAFFLDEPIATWLAHHVSKAFRHGMTVVSRVGDWPAHIALGTVCAVIAWWRGSQRWLRIFLAMLLACALAGVAARVIKIAAGRARPSVQTEHRWSGPRLTAKYQSFPSGHTASSTAFFVALFLGNRRIGASLLAIPCVIAFSRMIVGAHYISDVVFAAILGVLCAILINGCLRLSRARSESIDG